MTFQASDRVFPGYNVMGTAKAALENEVRQLAWDLGRDNIRVNAISAGPVDTLSSRVISGYRDMKRAHADRSPMGRNITRTTRWPTPRCSYAATWRPGSPARSYTSIPDTT